MSVNNLILIGFKNAGKTTYGRKLAEVLGWSFIDLDDVVSSLDGRGLSPRAICNDCGIEKFRQLEVQAVESLKDSQHCVIATGGGVVLDQNNVAILKTLGTIVLLQQSADTLLARLLEAKELPSFIDAANPKKSFMAMYEQRLPLYEVAADTVVTIGKLSEEKVLAELAQLVEKS